jgi:hypothetical protein
MASRTRLSVSLILGFVLPAGVFTFVASGQKGEEEAATTVTGCLHKGDETDVFAIAGENGKNYELVSRNVKLSAHVGHEVRVSGTLMDEESEEQEGKAGERWAGRMYVRSLKMLSETCKQSD